jgi:hypothetical protein
MVSAILTGNEGGVLCAAADLLDWNVVAAQLGQVVVRLRAGHLGAQTQLAVAVTAPRENLGKVTGSLVLLDCNLLQFVGGLR